MYLRSVKIGDNSFTTVSEDNWDDEWDNDGMNCSIVRSFHILNCERLELIEIGGFSFSNYSGKDITARRLSLRTLLPG